MAINSYRTAALYYPVKVEYYKELLRLLEEQERWDDIVLWAQRALVVDDWLLKKPPIRWQLYLWLGKAHRALGAIAIESGDLETGLEQWREAEEALTAGLELSNMVYYVYYELGQIYEAYGDMAMEAGDTSTAMDYYSQTKDMYVQAFNRKDNVPSGQQPFDYAYYLLGRIYEKLGEPDDALRNYRLLLTQSLYSPGTETYQKGRTRIHELTGEWEGHPPPGGEPEPGGITNEPS
jgi:tetratricopeptide (TPR) repeat protein